MEARKKGTLHIVGTGIKSISHLTMEAKNLIISADKVLYAVCDDLTKEYLFELNPSAESMSRFYEINKHRRLTYNEMADYSMEYVRKGLDVCVAYYGHPGVFVTPSFLAMDMAREEGYFAQMLPGISAEDCLFCDLGFDPATPGCQTYEATDFLIHNRSFDINSNLVLWQIGCIGHIDYQNNYDNKNGLTILMEHLLKFYPGVHSIVIYEAAMFNVSKPVIDIVELRNLSQSTVSAIATLYVPPLSKQAKVDLEMLRKLNIPESYISRNNSDEAESSSLFNVKQFDIKY